MAKQTIFLDNERVMRLYFDMHYTIQQVADEFGVSKRTIEQHFIKYDIKKRSRSEIQLLDIPGRKKHNITREQLIDLYHHQKLSTKQIADIHEVSTAIITKLFRRYEINPRSKQEQQALVTRTTRHGICQSFINASKLYHGVDNYLYDNVVYTDAHTKVTIECQIHGTFLAMPYKHQQGNGCPRCARVSFSRAAISWIEYISITEKINIKHALNGGEYRIPGTRYFADGFCETNNTIYEFNGDCWHGNPDIYHHTDFCHPYDNQLTAGQLFARTNIKYATLIELGYNVVCIWENDWTQLLKEMSGTD
jgi:predicted DNA-binding protein YlxM (UPF0122 family)